ncbi:hypothetical protein [Paenibacillus roseipurpureus]|uniref:Uncharacterized protein n=1 Tax=Paenibacillus roseopurpureus TaxID=2918901 RepID=A0AA96LQ10_9BACL|nr:hypothetical protein [Paenibacillus sp. MBLB1832]WNR45207.1 hypothetical protein MJB10_03465 [Paenibacillus sp. MBLB1832]
MWWIILVLILLLSLIMVYRITLRVGDKVRTAKVIKMSLHGKKTAKLNKQQCSFCRKRDKKLAFYSDEQGRVVGVCSVCRPQAERRALMRL